MTATTTTPPTENGKVGADNIGPDGEVIKDMTYYNLLNVRGDASTLELKKAYRQMAIKFHPDKNVGDDSAQAKFQSIGEAYAILSDSNSRATYNKIGIKQGGAAEAAETMDAGAIFATMFGGEVFFDWIGEISLGKDVSKAFKDHTTDEERDELKNELTKESSTPSATTAATPLQSTLSHSSFVDSLPPSFASTGSPATATPAAFGGSVDAKAVPTTSFSPTTASASPPSLSSPPPSAPAVKPRPTPEERAETEAYERARTEEKKERLRLLTQKLVDRCRPFVEALRPGEEDDAETVKFAKRIKEEVQDLAMASFGVELCQLIGTIYMSKASAYLRLNKSSASNFLGVPGWWNRVREKGKMLKEGYSFLSVGLDVHSAMKDMARRQEEITLSGGELDEEETKKMEAEMSGILLLVAWKGSKFELSSLLRSVVDGALNKEVEMGKGEEGWEKTLMNRAKAILLTGAIMKSVQPDETDTERRELERMVAAADIKRKEKKTRRAVVPPPTAAPAAAVAGSPLPKTV